MGRLFIAIYIALALVACSQKADAPEQYSPDSFTVSMVWAQNSGSLQEVARSYGETSEVDGFSVMTRSADGYRCEIHIVRPASLSRAAQELIGHEFAHCLYGAYHPKGQR
jgi:hypothetical protein